MRGDLEIRRISLHSYSVCPYLPVAAIGTTQASPFPRVVWTVAAGVRIYETSRTARLPMALLSAAARGALLLRRVQTAHPCSAAHPRRLLHATPAAARGSKNLDWYYNALEEREESRLRVAEPVFPAETLHGRKRARAFIDFQLGAADAPDGATPLGRVVVELADDLVPLTVRNFLNVRGRKDGSDCLSALELGRKVVPRARYYGGHSLSTECAPVFLLLLPAAMRSPRGPGLPGLPCHPGSQGAGRHVWRLENGGRPGRRVVVWHQILFG